MIRQISNITDASNNSYYNYCSGALSIVMPQEAVNQVQNPSFELYTDAYLGTTFSGWSLTRRSGGVNTTITDISTYITTGTAWSGANSVYTANVLGSDFVSLQYASVVVDQSKYYAFSFYIYGAAGSSRRTYTATVSVGASVRARKTFSLIEGQWQRVEVAFFSQSGSSTVTLTIAKDPVGTSYAGANAYIDAVQFEELYLPDADIGSPIAANLHATTYFDGDTTGFIDDSTSILEYAWRGKPHWSQSVRSGATASGGRIYNLQDEFDLNIIGIAEAGINQPQVQAVTFNSQDGGSLQDIINPVRTITFIGQIIGEDKIDLSRKIQRLTALLSRDLVSQRQDRRFFFQHKDGRENVGVEMTFSGAFVGGLNIMATDTLSVNVDISIQMHDPYFYGHDESMRLLDPTNRGEMAYRITPYDTATKTTLIQPLGVGVIGSVVTSAQAPDGRVWIGGNFLTSGTGAPMAYIAIWDPRTNALSAVPGSVLNGQVNCIKFSPDGIAWIAGQFTGTMGNYLTTHNGAGYSSTGNFGANVTGIEIVPLGSDYEVYAVGAFTSAPGVATANRIARYRTSTGTWSAYATGNGFNAFVYCVTYDQVNDRLYVGGNFTQTQGGAVLCNRVAMIDRLSGSVSALGTGITNNSVLSLYVDADGSLIIGGTFTAPFNVLCYYANNAIRVWPKGFTTVISGSFVGVNSICAYKDGIFVGTTKTIASTAVAVPAYLTALPALSYWNGTALSGSEWIPIGGTRVDTRYSVTPLPDGSLIVGSDGGTNDDSARITQQRNSSTVAAYPTIRMNFFATNSVTQMYAIINARDTKTMIFNDRYEVSSGNPDINLDFIDGDVVYVKPRYSTVKSVRLGNMIRVMNSAGSFVDFVIRPGQVSLALLYNSIYVSDHHIDVYWPQTFQSIFDGVYKS